MIILGLCQIADALIESPRNTKTPRIGASALVNLGGILQFSL
jgi:hypothetical protein